MFRFIIAIFKKRTRVSILIIVFITLLSIRKVKHCYVTVPGSFTQEIITTGNTHQAFLNETKLEGDFVSDKESEALTLGYWELTSNSAIAANTSGKVTKLVRLPDLWRSENQQHLSRDDDRILAQLVFGMGAKDSHFGKNATPKIQMKTIFLPDSFQWWGKSSWENPHVLNEEDCPGLQQKCAISQNPDSDLVMDALITVRDTLHTTYFNVSSHILKFYFILEPPFISEATLENSNELLASFYRGSDVNTPYGKWVYYDPSVKFKTQERNFSAGKTKMAAIFTSNCGTWNHRMDFIWELQKYVSVDVYGVCGQLSCPLYKQKECFAMLQQDYHFYLSFENSNCRDYVTEKLFVNAYENDVIPVVLGAHPEDYKAICPEKSYIHVEDFENPEELTNYMKHLVATPDEYNSYFRWKDTGQFINTNFFCRVCAMVHYADIFPPPERKSKFSWNAESAIVNKFCLPSGIWYWKSSFGSESQVSKAAFRFSTGGHIVSILVFLLVLHSNRRHHWCPIWTPDRQ